MTEEKKKREELNDEQLDVVNGGGYYGNCEDGPR